MDGTTGAANMCATEFAFGLQSKADFEQEKSGREDAIAAVVKLQDVIEAVRGDLDEAQAAADRWLPLPEPRRGAASHADVQ